MESLKNLDIQSLIDMLVKQTTQYAAKLGNSNKVQLQQEEYNISILVAELRLRSPILVQ